MKLLKMKPEKDGVITEYVCGLKVHGGWRTRLEKHKDFCNSEMGKYILMLESKAEKLPISGVKPTCIIEFCFINPDGTIDVRYRRQVDTPEADKLIQEYEDLRKRDSDKCPYFYRYVG